MDYKEKYENAIKRANAILEVAYNREEAFGYVSTIFPELAESEDARIRKSLIALVRQSSEVLSKQNQESMIAWLEKQKDINSKEYVFRPLAGCDIESAATQAVEQQKLGKKIVLAFNGAYIPVEGKTADDIVNEYYSWVEKQGSITKLNEEKENKLAKSVLISCATSFINYLDAHKYDGKMCVSNGECEDIENSFLNAMWDRLHRYYCKYIEKQVKQKTIDIESMVKAYKQRIIKQDDMKNNPLIDMCLASFKHGVENTLDELNGEQILANSAKTCKNEHGEQTNFTEFEEALADVCRGWIGEEIGWKDYIKTNADALLKISFKMWNHVQELTTKTTWNEEDEKAFEDLIGYLNFEGQLDSSKFIVSLKDRLKRE